MGDPLTLLVSLAFVAACFAVLIPVVLVLGRLAWTALVVLLVILPAALLLDLRRQARWARRAFGRRRSPSTHS